MGFLYFARIKTELLDTGPYPIRSYLEGNSKVLRMTAGVQEWAEENGIRELWEMQPEFGEIDNRTLSAAFQLFANPSSRPVAGMLLMTRATDEQLVETLQEYLELPVTGDVLTLYRKVFWDASLPSEGDWNELIEDFETDNERHLISLGLGGQDIHQARDALRLTTDVPIDTMLKEMLNVNHMKWRNACQDDSDAEMAAWQACTIKVIKEIREHQKVFQANEGMPQAGDFEGLFSVQVSRTIHPTLAELGGESAPRPGEGPVKNADE